MTPDEIKALREKFSVSQETLARVIGVSWRTVNRWEKGEAKPSPMAERTLRAISRKKTLRI